MSPFVRSLGLSASLGLFAGCSLFDKPLVGVDTVRSRLTYDELDTNVLSTGERSVFSKQILDALDLHDAYEDDPEETLRELHAQAVELPFVGLRHALSELHFQEAERKNSREHYLASAIYAYTYLFPEPGVKPPSPFDRRFRWACELYNRALTEAFREESTFELAGGERSLPVGSLDIDIDRTRFPWKEDNFPRLQLANDMRPWGLGFRGRDSGLGVPLVCTPDEDRVRTARAEAYFPEKVSVPATAFLRFEGSLADLSTGAGRVAASLELVSTFARRTADVGTTRVPLESDLTTPLAYTLEESKDWGFRLRGFMRASEGGLGLQMTQPYSPRKIPVVLVHGTASSRAAWAQMINFLQMDPVLRARVQFWTYQYPTGQPISLSAAELRETLAEVVRTVDPESNDTDLSRMVIIGHSQGGLLTKMTAVDGSPDWFEQVTGVSVGELDPENRELVLRVSDFDPSPHVKRVVFVATPHRGSFLADMFFADIAADLVDLPGQVVDVGRDIISENPELAEEYEEGVATAVDNMKTDNPLLDLLDGVPVAQGIASHSIVAIKGGGPAEEGDDGVVSYESAHRDDVDTELVVRANHGCLADAKVILEIRRILLEHVGSGD